MKASILGLALATAAFAGSSVYLWQQLAEERARSAQVAEESRALNARIAELEQSRNLFAQRKLTSSQGMVFGSFSSETPPPPMPSSAQKADEATKPVWSVNRAAPTPAMQKMFRTQTRARNKRLYADAARELGLSKEKTAALIDLLTEQQMVGMGEVPEIKSAADAQRLYLDRQRATENAISDLLGADKAMALKEYQQTLPARMEFEMFERQLVENDAALSESQRKQLLNVYLEERERVPAPEYRSGVDPKEFMKANNAWKEEYEKRVADEASRILDSTQLATYNDIRQGEKEMREHFATVEFVAPPVGQAGLAIEASQNIVTYSAAAPVSGIVVKQEAPASRPNDTKP